MKNTIILCGALFLFLLGCDKDNAAQSTSAPTPAPQASPQPPLPAINNFTDTTNEIQALKQRIYILELAKDSYKTAAFDPTGDKSYQRVDSNIGYFLVLVDNVEPYLDGQKISLLIGNPNNVTYSGAMLKVGWSARMPDFGLPPKQFNDAMNVYTASKKETQINLTDILRPGNWNKVSFTIAPAKSTEFGNLEIGITTNQVSLAGGRQQ